MTGIRTKRCVQIPLLKAAAIMLAARHGKPGSIGGHELTDVDLGSIVDKPKYDFALDAVGVKGLAQRRLNPTREEETP